MAFADSGYPAKRYGNTALLWFARQYNLPEVVNNVHELCKEKKAGYFQVLWYTPANNSKTIFPADKFFDGKVPVAFFRKNLKIKIHFGQVLKPEKTD